MRAKTLRGHVNAADVSLRESTFSHSLIILRSCSRWNKKTKDFALVDRGTSAELFAGRNEDILQLFETRDLVLRKFDVLTFRSIQHIFFVLCGFIGSFRDRIFGASCMC